MGLALGGQLPRMSWLALTAENPASPTGSQAGIAPETGSALGEVSS